MKAEDFLKIKLFDSGFDMNTDDDSIPEFVKFLAEVMNEYTTGKVYEWWKNSNDDYFYSDYACDEDRIMDIKNSLDLN
jgi:hypothetical protein